MRPSFISLDWGTSSLRATLVSDEGSIIEARSTAGGVMAVKDRQFQQSLNALCEDWIDIHRCPVIASGMIGSRQGWVEAPYLDCPATPAAAAQSFTSFSLTEDVDMHIVPGLRCRDANGVYDVMRGEEIQIWGAEVNPETCCVLPGTHSKWAYVGDDARITRFATYMTGELYGLMTKHGILGRLMAFGNDDPEAFAMGAKLGLQSRLDATHAIFAARTAGLMNQISPTGLPDYLSGILIGVEVASALGQGWIDGRNAQAVVLIGDDDLCRRYESVLRLADLESVRARDGATTRGHIQIAKEAGILRRVEA